MLAATLLLVACGDNNENPDAGLTPDAGAADGGGTDAGGEDAGFTACTLGGTDCMAGESCILLDTGATNLASFCVPGACDLVEQDCMNGQACGFAQVDGKTQRTCGPAGTGMEGAECTNAACAAGLACVILAQGQPAVCLRYCNTNADCSAPDLCNQAIAPQGTNERPLVCAPPPAACDVLAQDCADQSQGCFLTNNGPACLPAGTAAVGEPCQNTRCVKGATCVTLQDAGTECATLCGFPNTEPTCQTGTCAQLSTQSGPVLDGGVGVCRTM